jgi:hypothetical protein
MLFYTSVGPLGPPLLLFNCGCRCYAFAKAESQQTFKLSTEQMPRPLSLLCTLALISKSPTRRIKPPIIDGQPVFAAFFASELYNLSDYFCL